MKRPVAFPEPTLPSSSETFVVALEIQATWLVPRWGAWLDDRLYYDGSPATRHVQNIHTNPAVTLHLEDGSTTHLEIRKPREGIASVIKRIWPKSSND